MPQLLSWKVVGDTDPKGWDLLVADAKRLAGLAAKLGAALALLCHLLPPHYRPICDALASACTGGH